ncbi:MAG TPA: TlpA disulfide reductase family protein [Allosphingosinicella sp.]|nr:TlpA disulfide reductase family protein [Allosphingosinicella sp.]
MRPVIACLPALLTVLALSGCDRQKADPPQGAAPEAANEAGNQAAAHYPTGRLDRSHAGAVAPSVRFEDPEGRPVTLASFRGKPLLVNFWATWCGPCIVEMPALDRLAAREGETVTVLAISQDSGGRQLVEDFFGRRSFQRLEPYLDAEMRMMTALQLDTLPTTILYDAEGREVWRMTGMAEWEGERAARLLTEAEGG